MSNRDSQERENTRFGGYGDRVGSAIELAPVTWKGGEIVTDPTLITKSLKPRKFYYSPIGDGTVAADGIELKRGPVDLAPKVTVIEQRIVEKGQAGQAGRTVIEKTWTSGGDGDDLNSRNAEYGNRGVGNYPPNGGYNAGVVPPPLPQPQPQPGNYVPHSVPDDGRNSRNTNISSTVPSPFETLGDLVGAPRGAGPSAPAGYTPSNTVSPTTTFAGRNFGGPPAQPNPYQSHTPSSLYENRIKSKSPSNGLDSYAPYDYPTSGRTSTTSGLLSEPGFRYEIKKDYKVTNPRELIHQYATTTPITSIKGHEQLTDGGVTTQIIKQTYSSTTEESYGPYSLGQNALNPKKFVQNLRDQTMTVSQRQANQNTQALNAKDSQYEHKIEDIKRATAYRQQASPNPEIDSLTSRLVSGFNVK